MVKTLGHQKQNRTYVPFPPQLPKKPVVLSIGNLISLKPLKTVKKSLLWVGASLFLSLVALTPMSARAQATNLVTDTTSASLISALRTAQTNGGSVLIDVDGTIKLNSTLTITTNILIQARTNRSVVISGDNAVRVFSVKRDAVLTLVNLWVENGRSSTGAGIYNDGGTVMALGCYFRGNTATNLPGANGTAGSHSRPNGGNGMIGGNASGGAIYSSGNLYLFSTAFTNNFAFAGTGGNGGNGDTNSATFGGNGGDGANGGTATGGAIYIAGGDAQIGWCNIANNTIVGGNGGAPGTAGPGGIDGNGGRGGMGSTAYGAAIYNAGTLSIFSSLFVNNASYAGSSAGVDPYNDGTSRDAFPGASALGGAIYNTGHVSMTNCTVAANLCEGGAGGNLASTANAHAGNGGNGCGGGIATAGTASLVELVNCTLWQNVVYGGTNGIAGSSNYDGVMGRKLGGNLCRSTGTVTLSNSILDSTTNTLNCYGTVVDGGYNICSDTSAHFSATGSLNGTSPMLGTALVFVAPPTNSPTFAIYRPGTHQPFVADQQATIPGLLPTSSSPVIDAIPTNGNYPAYDQRGFSRPQGSGVDIGAVELDNTKLAPTITKQPVGSTNRAGANITLSVQATGEAPLSYQWSFNEFAINNATNSTLELTSVTEQDSGSYAVVVQNPSGSVTSSDAVLKILAPVTLDGITVNDTVVTNLEVLTGTDTELSTAAHGASPFGYQWYLNGTLLTSETNSSIAITDLQAANAGTYMVVITNAISAISNSVVLVVHAPASISTQPVNKQLPLSSDVVLSLGTLGDQPIWYQWVWNGVTNAPSTNATFLIRYAQALQQNSYSVLISNRYNTNWVASSSAQVAFFPPLTITTQPESQSINYGGNAAFTVEADSQAGAVTYQWYRNRIPIDGETNDTLTINSAKTADAATYTVNVADAVSQVGSSNAVLAVGVPPTITLQPINQLLVPGGTVSFSVKAADSQPVTYQWWHDGVAIPGQTNATLTLRQLQSTNSGSYYAMITGIHGTITSGTALLIPKITITTPPLNTTVATGSRFAMLVAASGNPTRYQWYRNGIAIAGQTNAILTYGAATKSDAGVYRVRVANQLSSTLSANATLTVIDPPTLITETKLLTNVVGSALTLSAKPFGSAPFTYQWQLNSSNIPGATSATLVVPKTSPTSAGTYSVVVRNPVGIALSSNAVVTVVPSAPVIKSPVARLLSTNTVIISGTADPAANLEAVVLDVNGDSITADTTNNWRTWQAAASLIPGSNYVSVVAQAPYGNSKSTDTVYLYRAKYPSDPYAAKKGTYVGLFFDANNALLANSGVMNLALKEMGVFSGKIWQGTNAFPFSGQFNDSGLAIVRSGSARFEITLNTDISGTNHLSGSVTGSSAAGSDWSDSDLQLDKVVYSSTKPAPMAGRYTVAFPGETDFDGDGILALRVDVAGNVTVTGTMADSAAISGTGTVCAGGKWPMYLAANGGQGAIFGRLGFGSSNNLSGNANWICPSGNLFPNGINRSADVLASAYPSTTNNASKITLSAATATLSSANLTAPFTDTITLSKNRISVTSTNLSLKFNPTNGIVTGTFLDSDSGTLNPIYGIVLTNQNQIRGFFIGTNQSGSFKVE